MAAPRNALISAAVAYLARLRFPVLFALTATLFVVDLLLPDPLPLVDEVLLGLATALLASWRRRREPAGSDGSGTSRGRVLRSGARRW